MRRMIYKEARCLFLLPKVLIHKHFFLQRTKPRIDHWVADSLTDRGPSGKPHCAPRFHCHDIWWWCITDYRGILPCELMDLVPCKVVFIPDDIVGLASAEAGYIIVTFPYDCTSRHCIVFLLCRMFKRCWTGYWSFRAISSAPKCISYFIIQMAWWSPYHPLSI